jgi:hypothetical protein
MAPVVLLQSASALNDSDDPGGQRQQRGPEHQYQQRRVSLGFGIDAAHRRDRVDRTGAAAATMRKGLVSGP